MNFGREGEKPKTILRPVQTLSESDQEKLRMYLGTLSSEFPWTSLFVTQWHLIYRNKEEEEILGSVTDIFLTNSQDGLDTLLSDWP